MPELNGTYTDFIGGAILNRRKPGRGVMMAYMGNGRENATGAVTFLLTAWHSCRFEFATIQY